MNLIITGKKGIGKTTVCQQLLQNAVYQGYHCAGFLSEKDESNNIIIRDIGTGKQHVIAQLKTCVRSSDECRYHFVQKGFDFGNHILQNITNTDILIIDEIGKLELRGKGFYSFKKFWQVIPFMHMHILIVIRKTLLNDFTYRFPVDATIFEVSEKNRSTLHYHIMNIITKEA